MAVGAEDHGAGGLVGDLLAALRRHFGMDVAFVSEFTGGHRVFRYVDAGAATDVVVGAADPLEATYCQRIVEGLLPGVIPNVQENELAAALEVTERLNIASYIGVPITFRDGRIYGTLCCVGSAPAELGLSDLAALTVVADVVAAHLDRVEDHLGETLAVQARVEDVLDNQRFHPVFQPIVDLASGALVGVEALTRFTAEPQQPPHHWFAHAEISGLRIDLELAALAAALAHLDEVPASVYLSVNLSPAALPAAVPALKAANGRRLVVELTEHEEITDYEGLHAAVSELRARGVRFAIDDAGAGYSSLRHVLELRPDVVKLDISLTRGVDADPARQALCRSLVEFAGRLGATLVAEGVETAEELAALTELGVQCGQGYYLARPGPLPVPSSFDAQVAGGAPSPAVAPDAVHFAFVTAPMAIAVATAEGRLVDVNDAFCELVGRPARELRGKTWQDVAPLDGADPNVNAYARALAGESDTIDLVTSVPRADGTIIEDVALRARLLRDPQGRPRWFVTELVPPSPGSDPPL